MSEFISLETAVTMTTAFRQQFNGMLKTEYQGNNIVARAETFDKDKLQRIMDQQGCTAVRVYNGMDSTGLVHGIIVGVDANNRDILPSASASAACGTEDDPILELAIRCPDICDDLSALNG